MTDPQRWVPLASMRMLNMVLGVVIAAVGCGFGILAVAASRLGPPWLVVGAAFVVWGVVMCVRSSRLGIVFGTDELVVDGMLWTRRIPRSAVTSVTSLGRMPMVYWRSGGRERSTPLQIVTRNAVGASGPHAERAVAMLREWALRSGISTVGL